MNSNRIEEFRRKLREGRPVRVTNGQVLLDGASVTEGTTHARPNVGAAVPPAQPVPPPAGVQVKPHEWGAAGAAEPFYATRSGEARALAEQALLAQEYPGFVLDVDDDGTPFAHGWIGPNAALQNAYHVLVLIPPAYGQGAIPLGYVLEPKLRDGAPHRYTDGSLCVDHATNGGASAFTRKSTLVTFLAWVSVWLVLYEGWVETGAAW